jgi:hypothetical protein
MSKGFAKVYKSPVASAIPFDNSGSDYTAENVDAALKEVKDLVEGGFDFSNATSFEAWNDDGVSSTTSTSPQTKLSETTETDRQGRYIVVWYFQLTNSGNNNISNALVEWKPTNSGTWQNLLDLDLLIPRGESYIPVSGFRIINHMTDVTIDLRIRYFRTDGTARIKDASLYIFRVELT